MSELQDADCRLCRREGMKLFLKGHRCVTPKCAIARRNVPPGQHGRGRLKASNYAMQLREKQKVKRIYGLKERQFRRYFRRAERAVGVTGAKLLQLLELRLDNVITRANFATSRSHARQIVSHGLTRIDGQRLRIPSYEVRAGDKVTFRANDSLAKQLKETHKAFQSERVVPGWLKADLDALTIEILRVPDRNDVNYPIQEQLIVELYSR